MEYLEGETLKQVLGRGPVALDDVLDWGCQVAEALATAHSHGVIHRDVKPENLFLVADARRPGRKQVKVLDFGIAKLQRLTMDQVHKTRTGTLLGTPLYMSPEQCLSLKDIDARSDVYSLGVILYEMVAGKRPFDGDGLFVVISRHITEQPVAPTAHRADLPPHIEAVILQALGWNYVYNDSMCSYGGTITTCTRGGDGLCYQECKTRFRLHEPDLPVHPCRTGRQASVGASAWVPDPLRARIGAVGLCPAAGNRVRRFFIEDFDLPNATLAKGAHHIGVARARDETGRKWAGMDRTRRVDRCADCRTEKPKRHCAHVGCRVAAARTCDLHTMPTRR